VLGRKITVVPGGHGRGKSSRSVDAGGVRTGDCFGPVLHGMGKGIRCKRVRI